MAATDVTIDLETAEDQRYPTQQGGMPMTDAKAEIARVRELLATDPDAMAAAGGGGDYQAAAGGLARYAASKGISVTEADVKAAFQERNPPEHAEPLDDDALDKVAGGHSPWCFATHGCYCFGTH
jgi:hypothetical protein